MSRPSGKQSIRTIALEGACIFMAVALGLLIRARLFESAFVTSRSMEPTLSIGDRLLVNKEIYQHRKPQRGDIVIVQLANDPEETLVKRVIGLPGEEIALREGRVYINAQVLVEPYLKERSVRETPRHWMIPADTFFLLGDNRNLSEDSRDYGPLPLSVFVGKVVFVYYPPNRFGRI